jgi:hypothetical protein
MKWHDIFADDTNLENQYARTLANNIEILNRSGPIILATKSYYN